MIAGLTKVLVVAMTANINSDVRDVSVTSVIMLVRKKQIVSIIGETSATKIKVAGLTKVATEENTIVRVVVNYYYYCYFSKLALLCSSGGRA